MKKRMWFLLSVGGLVLLLFSLPSNSRADTIHQQQTGPLNSQGHGVGLLIATERSAPGLGITAAFRFGGAKEAMAGGVGRLVGPDTYAGRPLFGESDWGGKPNVWTGTSYVFGESGDHGEHNGDDNGNHYGDNNGNHNGENNGNHNGNNNGNNQSSGIDNNNLPVQVPEPATYLLLATGLVGLLVYRRFSDVDM